MAGAYMMARLPPRTPSESPRPAVQCPEAGRPGLRPRGRPRALSRRPALRGVAGRGPGRPGRRAPRDEQSRDLEAPPWPISRRPAVRRGRPGPARSDCGAPRDRQGPVPRGPAFRGTRPGPGRSDCRTPRDRRRAISRSPAIWRGRPGPGRSLKSPDSRDRPRAIALGSPDTFRSAPTSREGPYDLEGSARPDALRSPDSRHVLQTAVALLNALWRRPAPITVLSASH